MDYSTLRAELTDDPLGRGYANLTDAEAAESLNAVDVTVTYPRFVTARTLLAELGPAQSAGVLQALQEADDPDGTIALALSMLKTYGTGGGINFGHANTRAFIDALAAAEVLTSDQATALRALGETVISRAAELGLPAILPGYVTKARATDGQ